MRSSKISRDAVIVTKTLSPSGPKRITRTSLQKFTHVEPSTTTVAETTITANTSRKRKRNTPPSTTTTTITPKTSATKDVKAPKNWETLYTTLRSFRSTFTAPVDTMGCERLADLSCPPRIQRFHVLVGLLLSSQTKDAVTANAVRNLQTTLPGGLTPESVSDPKISIQDLDACISKVGFHNTKAKNLKIIGTVLIEKFNGDVPKTAEELMSLPGIGPKMAYLCLSAAWDLHYGIGVDTHVHRITNLWGWHKTKTPEETRQKLEMWLPRENWHEINTLVVGLGQTVCIPGDGRRRKCGECGLGGICPASSVKRSWKKKEDVDIEDLGI